MPVNELGLIIKQLQRKHDISGQELSRQIGIAASSLSQIVNGHAKPRQGTFTKICQVLGTSPDDEKKLVDAFVHLSDNTPETIVIHTAEYEQAEIERAERFLEIKTQSIAFKKSIARELEKAGLNYSADYSEGIYVTDFLVEHQGRRLALECKFNTQRDFEKTVRIAGLLLKNLKCDQALIVCPYLDERLQDDINIENVRLVAVSGLIGEIKTS